jgi:hypothetical protein
MQHQNLWLWLSKKHSNRVEQRLEQGIGKKEQINISSSNKSIPRARGNASWKKLLLKNRRLVVRSHTRRDVSEFIKNEKHLVQRSSTAVFWKTLLSSFARQINENKRYNWTTWHWRSYFTKYIRPNRHAFALRPLTCQWFRSTRLPLEF